MKEITLQFEGDCEATFPDWLMEVAKLINSGSMVTIIADPEDRQLETFFDGDGSDRLWIVEKKLKESTDLKNFIDFTKTV